MNLYPLPFTDMYNPTQQSLADEGFSIVDEYRKGSFYASHDSGLTYEKLGGQKTWKMNGSDIEIRDIEDLRSRISEIK